MVLNAGLTFATRIRVVGGVLVTVALFLALPAEGLSGQEIGSGQCMAAAVPVGWNGITGFVCNCSSSEAEEPGGQAQWDFRTEPEILGIGASGPADGALEEGDRVVSIDGFLITTRAGGTRWSNPVPGETMNFRVRREGRVEDVSITIGSRCPGATSESRPTPDRQASAASTTVRLLPRGWLGFGIMCDCSVSTGVDYARWTFESNPIIREVVPAGPADDAGVRSGDAIVAIDGLRITAREGSEFFSSVVPGQVVRLRLVRNGVEMEVTLTVGTHPGSG